MNLHCYVCKMWGHTKVNCPMKKVPPSTPHRAAPRSTARRTPPSSAQQRLVRGGGTSRLLLEHHAGSTERARARARLRHDKVCAPEQLAKWPAQLAVGSCCAC